jgi:hypothetical protein
MADNDLDCCASFELNECRQDIYNPYDCLKCQKLGNKLQHALDEVSSLQLIKKLLVKELEQTTAKLEVMTGASVKLKSAESQNRWISVGPKRHKNTARNSELKDIYTPYFHITTNNRYDALSNLMDYPPSKDVTSVMHGQRLTKKLKVPHHTEIVQTKHYTEYRSMAPKNGSKHHI